MPAGRLSHFPMYFRDYLLSKTRLKMTAAQRGAYIDILCLCYDSEDGCIEWDDDYLIKLTGATKEDINIVQRVFNDSSTGLQHTSTGRWTHPRVQAELKRMSWEVAAKSRGGKSSAAKRLSTRVEDPPKRSSRRLQVAEQSIALRGGSRPQAGPTPLAAPLPAPSGGPSATPPPDTRTREEIETERAELLAGLAEMKKNIGARR